MKIFDYLDQSKTDYTVTEHRPAYSAQIMAAAEHEKGRYVAKPVIVKSGTDYIMCVLAAPQKVDFEKLQQHLGAEEAAILATEKETQGLFPDCEEGAEPPFGNLYGLRTIMDRALEQDDHIVFQAGTHDKAIHMRLADYLSLAHPEIAEFACQPAEPT